MWEKMPIEGAIHLRSHNIPLSLFHVTWVIRRDIAKYFTAQSFQEVTAAEMKAGQTLIFG